MADPATPLTGWPYVADKALTVLPSLILSLAAMWWASRANDHAADAGHKADAAHVEAMKPRVFYGAAPKE